MLKNKLVLLTLVTVVVIIAAAVFVNLRAPQTEKEKVAFFPELADQIESVNHISIQGYAETINLTRINNVWGIDEFDGYPALPEKVKSTVLGAADLKINAPKTSLPRLYHRLGVEGPEVEDTTSLLLTLEDTNKNNIVNVIVGNPRRSSAAQSSPGLYIRQPDDPQSYLADGVLEITATKTDWIERSLFDVPADAVQSVRIDHPDGDTFTLFRSEVGQEDFEVENLPPGKKAATKLIINRFGSVLQDIQISGARAKDALETGSAVIRARVSTFQGVITDMTAFDIDGIAYASFDFLFDESLLPDDDTKDKIDEIKTFIADLNQRTSGWWFEIPAFKYDIVKKRSNNIMRDDSSGPDVEE